MSHIPVLDFSGLSDKANKTDSESETINRLGREIKTAFETVGFCYVKNHGIKEELIQKYHDLAKQFFTQPESVKQSYSHENSTEHFGWVANEGERLNPERPADLRECFNFAPAKDPGYWEPGEKDFRDIGLILHEECKKLADKVFKVLSTGLGLDERFFSDTHQHVGLKDNYSVLRCLYYPPIDDESKIKPGQIRLGEHYDFGTLTLLFQDEIGGLEVEIPGMGFVPATPIPGTVVVNIGYMMQRWSADKLIATKHRVLVPEKELIKRACRQSFGFFVHPDNDVTITCIDGSNKYEPITSLEFMTDILSKIY